jgi:prevent-host-death family protein
MTATLSQSQAELPRLVELASQGEDVVITVEGKPKARLTRAGVSPDNSAKPPPDMAAWLRELEEVRRKYATGRTTATVEQILDEDRADHV